MHVCAMYRLHWNFLFQSKFFKGNFFSCCIVWLRKTKVKVKILVITFFMLWEQQFICANNFTLTVVIHHRTKFHLLKLQVILCLSPRKIMHMAISRWTSKMCSWKGDLLKLLSRDLMYSTCLVFLIFSHSAFL